MGATKSGTDLAVKTVRSLKMMRKIALTLLLTIYALFSPFLVLNVVSETTYANATVEISNDGACQSK